MFGYDYDCGYAVYTHVLMTHIKYLCIFCDQGNGLVKQNVRLVYFSPLFFTGDQDPRPRGRPGKRLYVRTVKHVS